MPRKYGNRGFTLVEVVVAMGLFVIVIMITGTSFNTILSKAGLLQRSEESNIEGMIGLEMLRHDLQQAGFGLFTEIPPVPYKEAEVLPASLYNDADDVVLRVPRPLVSDNLVSDDIGEVAEGSNKYNVIDDTDYLAIKGTTVGISKTAQKWSYLIFDDTTVTPNIWPSSAENFASGDYMVLLRRQFTKPPRVSLEMDTTGSYFFKHGSATFDHYADQGAAVFTMYGLYNHNSNIPKIPFNRTDYFVARPKEASRIPPVCAPYTGILYKTTVNQADGMLTYMPILDCVADMQVVLGWDINLDGVVDTWSSANGEAATGVGATGDPNEVEKALSQDNNNANTQATINIRNCLKVVKVYIIAQNGRKDTGYLSPAEIPIGDLAEKILIRAGGSATTAVKTLSDDMRNYRWKEYRIIVRPKNLTANQ